MDMEKLVTALCVVLGLPTLIEISPIKINPWSWVGKMLKFLWRGFCRSLNADVLEQLAEVKQEQKVIKAEVSAQKDLSDKREADGVKDNDFRYVKDTKERSIFDEGTDTWYPL